MSSFSSVVTRCARIAPLLAIGCLFASMPVGTAAAGTANCAPPAVSSITADAGGGSYVIGRNAVPGPVLTPWSAFTAGPDNLFVCTITMAPSGDYFGSMRQAGTGLTPADMGGTNTIVIDGTSYIVYKTNVDGIGMVMKAYGAYGSGNSTTWFPGVTGVPQAWRRFTAWTGGGVTNLPDQTASGAIAFAFVRTGPISGGTVNYGGAPVAEFAAAVTTGAVNNGANGGPQSAIVPITLINGPTFVSASCVTPDVLVDLGRHSKSSFTGTDYTTPSVDFNIKLNSCPAGMNSVRYRIDPATTVQLPAQSVVALDGTSTATGVGVQLLNGAGGVHPLGVGTDQVFAPYNKTTGGDYTIPLKANYYQTSPTVTPGQANTTMTFTMTYL
ncbi:MULTISPECIES: fimbrial protein [unclassified Lysobacter]|uniref:fimbrial protein n=1 Tax=unclassified Lysobacter TaxID=2635362 RepID=UPI0020B44F18|nr:fimbrial protein [Lysobacter sp. MMG2]